ncbi:unnamed protein product [Aureobasidium pullulans]|nr:unnamed protein product [Aureobasidium pullulans]
MTTYLLFCTADISPNPASTTGARIHLSTLSKMAS